MSLIWVNGETCGAKPCREGALWYSVRVRTNPHLLVCQLQAFLVLTWQNTVTYTVQHPTDPTYAVHVVPF